MIQVVVNFDNGDSVVVDFLEDGVDEKRELNEWLDYYEKELEVSNISSIDTVEADNKLYQKYLKVSSQLFPIPYQDLSMCDKVSVAEVAYEDSLYRRNNDGNNQYEW